MATAGFVLSIVSVIFCWLPGIGVILAIIGLILSIVATVKAKDGNKKGFSIAGIVISSISVIVGAILTLVILSAMLITANSTDLIESSINTLDANTRLEVQSDINMYIAERRADDPTLTVEDIVKDELSLGIEDDIVYDSDDLIDLDITSIGTSNIALSDSGKTYYKIDESKLESYVGDVDGLVIDSDGIVYVNSILE